MITKKLEDLKAVFQQFSLAEQKSLISIFAKIETVSNKKVENKIETVTNLKFEEVVEKIRFEVERGNIYQKILDQGCQMLKEGGLIRIQNVVELWHGIDGSFAGGFRDTSALEWPQFGVGVVGSHPAIKVIKQNLINSCLDDYLSLFHNPPEKKYPLEVCLLLHHYFEIIHPFKDGNGRLGRILISLFLIKNKLWIEYLFFPISYFIAKNKNDYCKR